MNGSCAHEKKRKWHYGKFWQMKVRTEMDIPCPVPLWLFDLGRRNAQSAVCACLSFCEVLRTESIVCIELVWVSGVCQVFCPGSYMIQCFPSSALQACSALLYTATIPWPCQQQTDLWVTVEGLMTLPSTNTNRAATWNTLIGFWDQRGGWV